MTTSDCGEATTGGGATIGSASVGFFFDLPKGASATRSWIALRLRDHSELLDSRSIHDVEHRDDATVGDAFVRLQQRAFDAASPQHRTERQIEIRRACGNTVEIHGPTGRDLNAC